MLDLAALRATLAAALAPVPVGGAAEFAAIIETGAARVPALWLLALEESAQTNRLNQGVQQRVIVQVGVVYAVRDVRDAQGQAAAESLSGLRQTVMSALVGALPAGGAEPLIFERGGLLHFQNALLYWQDQFSTGYYLRAI